MDPLPPFLLSSPPPLPPPSALRLEALYASTSSQRLANPTGYASNVQWWSVALTETLGLGWLGATSNASSSGTGSTSWGSGEAPTAAGAGDRLILRVEDGLLGRLEGAKGERVRGLGGVLESMISSSPPALLVLPSFVASPTPVLAPPSLTYRIVGRPLWWAMGQLNPFGGENVVSEETLWKRYRGKSYVHLGLLQTAADLFASHKSSHPLLTYTSALYSLSKFHQTFGRVCRPRKATGDGGSLSRKDCEVLLRWLQRDVGVIVQEGDVIKILDKGELAADHGISEADRGSLVVLETLRKVEDKVAAKEVTIANCNAKAKQYLSRGQKTLALETLRTKRLAEESLKRSLGVMTQLRTVVQNIDQAKSDIEIVAAYEVSSRTLSSVLSHPSLDHEYIARATDDLAEAMAKAEEVDEAVRIGGQVAAGERRVEIDEDELERELEGLIEEERAATPAPAPASAPAPAADGDAGQRQEGDKAAAGGKEEMHRGNVGKKVDQMKLAALHSHEEGAKRRVDGGQEELERAPARGNGERDVLSGGAGEVDAQWQERYRASQQRVRDEKIRSDEERLRKEARVVVAE